MGWEVQFIFHIVKYKLKRYKSRSDLYLFAKVDVCVRGLRCAPVAQIRGGFIKWDGSFAKVDVCVRGLRCAPVAQIRGGFINWDGGFAKVDGCREKLRCAPVAQIRGGFINWEWEVCESGLLGEITVRAGCANKRRIYKLGWGVCESGWV